MLKRKGLGNHVYLFEEEDEQKHGFIVIVLLFYLHDFECLVSSTFGIKVIDSATHSIFQVNDPCHF